MEDDGVDAVLARTELEQVENAGTRCHGGSFVSGDRVRILLGRAGIRWRPATGNSGSGGDQTVIAPGNLTRPPPDHQNVGSIALVMVWNLVHGSRDSHEQQVKQLGPVM